MSATDTDTTAHWQTWLQRWDDQQRGYIPDREDRFSLMLDLVEATVGDSPVILDLACGPGSISQRALARFPGARSVAVDADKALLHIGREALGDLDGRLVWVEADLRSAAWTQGLDEALSSLGAESIDAVLSATATHWLDPEDLAGIYAAVRERMGDAGVYVNADSMPVGGDGPLARAVDAVRQSRREESTDEAFETWEQWWDALALEPAVGPEIAARDHIGSGHNHVPTAEDHIAALAAAGFGEVRTITQDFGSRILAAF